jgi:tRNA (mo5U34)-methyltransferase
MDALLQLRGLGGLQVIDYSPLFDRLEELGLGTWRDTVPARVAAQLEPTSHGELPRWQRTLAELPSIPHPHADLTADCLRVEPALADPGDRARLANQFQAFHPWRKGPFCILGVHIDTEWHSDWKWQRVAAAIDLRGKRVLDVGCGNGYYGWRMLGAGASLVVGIDPTLLYLAQYAAVRHFIGDAPNWVLPLRLEDLPGAHAFDMVFSMGVLYHRRDPLDHLRALADQLRPGGELLLETLVIEGAAGEVLRPEARYAKMKNVHAIPTIPTALQWLADTGLRDARCIDVTPTTTEEQRSTEWMRFESLADFLDPKDADRTCEGYPAPVRAIFVARL